MDIITTLYKKLQFEKSIFRGRWVMDKEMYFQTHIKKEDLEDIAVRDMVLQLSKKILDEHKEQITRSDEGDFIEFEIDLMVINKGQLKNIVEGTILTMTDKQLYELRKNNKS